MKSKCSSPLQSNSHFPAWQGVYEAALHETDRIALFKLVEIAEATMLTHREILEKSHGHRLERQAIESALRILLWIKQAQLSFPAEN